MSSGRPKPGDDDSRARMELERRLRGVGDKTGIAWVDRAFSDGKRGGGPARPYRGLAPLGLLMLAVVLLALFLYYGRPYHGSEPLPPKRPVSSSSAAP